MKILIVDDDASTRDLWAQVAEGEGYEPISCWNGETALQLYEETPFPILTLDWNLPGLQGIDLCREIRKMPKGDQSVIIMITGRSEADTLDQILSAGANDYLVKPVDPSRLRVHLALAKNQWKHIVDRVKKEEELQVIKKYLETEVSRRTEQLQKALDDVKRTQEQVIQQERLRALGEMASGMFKASSVKNNA